VGALAIGLTVTIFTQLLCETFETFHVDVEVPMVGMETQVPGPLSRCEVEFMMIPGAGEFFCFDKWSCVPELTHYSAIPCVEWPSWMMGWAQDAERLQYLKDTWSKKSSFTEHWTFG